jgi:hypothetical protein
LLRVAVLFGALITTAMACAPALICFVLRTLNWNVWVSGSYVRTCRGRYALAR